MFINRLYQPSAVEYTPAKKNEMPTTGNVFLKFLKKDTTAVNENLTPGLRDSLNPLHSFTRINCDTVPAAESKTAEPNTPVSNTTLANSNLWVSTHQVRPPSEAEMLLIPEDKRAAHFIGAFTRVDRGAMLAAEAMIVPIGKNELPALMAEIEKAMANGESLQSVLEKQAAKHNNAMGNFNNDMLFINPNTGEVMGSVPKMRGYINYEGMDADYDSVKALADDLATFLRCTFFKREDDCSDEIAAILAEIKSRQSDHISQNTDRFDVSDTVLNEDNNVITAVEDDEPAEEKNMIDEFINAIGEHQNKMYNELHQMRVKGQ